MNPVTRRRLITTFDQVVRDLLRIGFPVEDIREELETLEYYEAIPIHLWDNAVSEDALEQAVLTLKHDQSESEENERRLITTFDQVVEDLLEGGVAAEDLCAALEALAEDEAIPLQIPDEAVSEDALGNAVLTYKHDQSETGGNEGSLHTGNVSPTNNGRPLEIGGTRRATGVSTPSYSLQSRSAQSKKCSEPDDEIGDEISGEVGKITSLKCEFEQENHSDCYAVADEAHDEASDLNESGGY